MTLTYYTPFTTPYDSTSSSSSYYPDSSSTAPITIVSYTPTRLYKYSTYKRP
jgi:hypothetical protein